MTLPEITKEDIGQILKFATPAMELMTTAEPVIGHPALQNLLEVMEAYQFTSPFDWQAEFEDRMEELESEAAIDSADLEKLRMIMTAHIRIDRMSDGHLETLIGTGYWNRCLSRLVKLYTEA